jgi:hypothetical protein
VVTVLMLATLGATDGALARNQVAARYDPAGVFDEGRVGYLFFERDHAAFNAPTLALVVSWWLEHPTRVGPVRFVGLAFTFRSDLS